MQKLTNDKTSKNTKSKKSKKTDDKVSQTMLIPINNSLTSVKPRFIKRFKNSKKLRLAIVYTISLTIMAFSFGQIIRLHNQKLKTLELVNNVQNYIKENTSPTNLNVEEQLINENPINESNYIVDFKSLKKINQDTKGWIKVNGVGIDFPVVQANDNKYYLKHSFDKSYNVCGWAFSDYRNKFDGTDKNIIIYGHNRRDGTMFSKMTEILKPSWYNDEKNKYITFITEDGEITYEVFSIYQTEVEDYYIQTKFNSNEDYQKFLNTLKSRSTKDYNVSLTTEDKIITLSTCGKDNKYRIVLHAKQI